MSAPANYFRLGLFVIIGIVLGIAGVIIFGGFQLFPESKLILETYFEESVQGLLEGSKVRMRGVAVGTVEHIGFVSSTYELSEDLDVKYGRWILVRAAIDPEAFEGQSVRRLAERLPARIEVGLRVRMASSGLTGAKFIEVDRLDPQRYPAFEPPWTPENTYVPSATGVFSAIVSSVDHIVEQMRALDLKTLLGNVENLVQSAERAIDGARVPELSAKAELALDSFQGILDGPEMRQSLASIREASESAKVMVSDLHDIVAGEKMRGTMDDLAHSGQSIREAADQLPAVVNRLDRTIQNLDRVITSESEDIQVLIMELRITIQNLRELSDLAKRYPASVLWGKEPPASVPEERP